MLVGLNDITLISKGIHDNCSCTCEQVYGIFANIFSASECNVHHVTYNGLTNLLSGVFCLKLVDFMWHDQACLMGECGLCGVETLHLCPNKLISKNVVMEEYRL